jgi:putative oxidoreductase
MQRFFATSPSKVVTFQRLVLAAVIGAHGAQKLLGAFGGWGFDGTVHWFTQDLGAPWLVAVLVILSDSLGMLALAAGFLTRFVAAGAALTMLGAIVLVHAQNGFFMNWAGAPHGEGYELHLLALALALPLVVTGGGAWSLDGILARRYRTEKKEKRAMKTITREALEAKIGAGTITAVEALPAEYYRKAHLPGALHLPHDAVDALAPALLADKGAPIAVYCASATCENSRIAAESLERLGYTDVSLYVGGKKDWTEAGLPVESGPVATRRAS